MKKYKDFNEFMAALEKLAKKQVNHYYTDFTDYDIPRLEKLNASKEKSEKRLIIILRDCGTWLIFADDVKDTKSTAYTIYNYYLPGGIDNPKRNPNKYYALNLLDYSIRLLNLDEKGREIPNKKKTKKAA